MIPTRALTALVATVFALALLLSFKTPDTGSLAAGATADSAIVGEPTMAPSDTPSAADTTSQPTSPTTAGTYADGTYMGSVVRTRFGDVQVEVTISGGQLIDVTALQLPADDHHSADISDQVEPILRESALVAQSAEIDLLSGATYTSVAYAESLQAALDAAT